jgi:AcrR family transcriptional regulator
MIHNTNVKPRKRYASALREEQADATRTRILEALVRTMANGVAGLSMPAVAREAGVSIPTIYRHFGSKQGLVEALQPYVVAKGRLKPDKLPETFADLEQFVRQTYRNLAGMDQTLRAAMASELGQQVRQATMPERQAMVRQSVGGLAPDLPAPELDRLASVFLILTSSPIFRALKDYLQLGPDASAELVIWAMSALIDGARIQSVGRKEPLT